MTSAEGNMRALNGRRIVIREGAPIACVNLRGSCGDSRFIKAVASVTDVAPPTKSCTSASGLFVHMLWLGPDEWLITSDTQRGEEITARLRQALQGVHAAVTELSDARRIFTISGEGARTLLAKGCGIDFHPREFLPGQVVQSLLAKASVIIERHAEDGFHVYVARSFADYVWAWLENAAAPFR